MSRGGRGGGGFGRGRGRGGFGAGNLPPMGLSFADIQAISKEETDLFPPMDTLPTMTIITDQERDIINRQQGFIDRLHKSKFFLVEKTKSNDLPRYSDKYRPQLASQPTLKRKDLNAEFFPTGLFETYFNPRKKQKTSSGPKKKKLNLDQLVDEEGEEEKSSDKDEEGSQLGEEDYDAEEEDDNDYVEDHFKNGEDDDIDDMVGGGDEEFGGGNDYD